MSKGIPILWTVNWVQLGKYVLLTQIVRSALARLACNSMHKQVTVRPRFVRQLVPDIVLGSDIRGPMSRFEKTNGKQGNCFFLRHYEGFDQQVPRIRIRLALRFT